MHKRIPILLVALLVLFVSEHTALATQQVIVPKVVGLKFKKAEEKIKNSGLKVKIQYKFEPHKRNLHGTILSQLPQFGTSVQSGTEVELLVATGKLVIIDKKNKKQPLFSRFKGKKRPAQRRGASTNSTAENNRQTPSQTAPHTRLAIYNPGEWVYSTQEKAIRWNGTFENSRYQLQASRDPEFYLINLTENYYINNAIEYKFKRAEEEATQYYFRVRDLNTLDPWTEKVSLIVFPCCSTQPPARAPEIFTLPASARLTFIVTSPRVNQVLMWRKDPSATSHIVEISTDRNFSNVIRSENTGTNITASFDKDFNYYRGLSPETEEIETQVTFFYRVKATNPFGQSGWSNVVEFRVIADGESTTAPTDAVVLRYDGSPTVNSWSSIMIGKWPVYGATKYEHQKSEDIEFTNPETQTFRGSGWGWLTYVLLNQSTEHDKIYYFRARGTNSHGVGPWSEALQITVRKYTQPE